MDRRTNPKEGSGGEIPGMDLMSQELLSAGGKPLAAIAAVAIGISVNSNWTDQTTHPGMASQ